MEIKKKDIINFKINWEEKSKNILGGTLVTHQTGEEGKKVNKLLVAEDVYYDGPEKCEEYYLSLIHI